jgi:sRNA-binding regulator protein Hfq
VVDRSNRGKPQVQVIRKGSGAVTPTAPLTPTAPVTPTTRPVTPSPSSVGPTPGASAAPARPSSPRPAARPAGRPGFRGPPRTAGPVTPPTAEAIAALARKERVPNRIARGELEGKMRCRIWKKLHAEEAKRFDQAWTLMEATPGLDLADAFGIVQSGMSVEDFRARRARAKRREAIKEARATVSPEAIDAFIAGRIAEKTELALVLGERTALDTLTAVAPVSFTTERNGQIEKLHVVVLTRKATWDRVLPKLERDPKLSQKPAPVARQPARRPVSDPRAFLAHVGQGISLQLRNGIKLEQPLLGVGPFDVLLGEAGEELFVPLHAIVAWAPAGSQLQA